MGREAVGRVSLLALALGLMALGTAAADDPWCATVEDDGSVTVTPGECIDEEAQERAFAVPEPEVPSPMAG